MTFFLFGAEIIIEFTFFLIITLITCMDRTGVISVMFLVVLLHEAGHILLILFLRLKIRRAVLGPFGIRLTLGGGRIPSYSGELAVYAAGPAANLLTAGLIFFCQSQNNAFLLFAVANCAIAVFNLLPIRGLDGGNMLYTLLRGVSRTGAVDTAVDIISLALLTALLTVAGWQVLQKHPNLTLIITSLYLAAMMIPRGDFHS